jgi:LysM repeat protein
MRVEISSRRLPFGPGKLAALAAAFLTTLVALVVFAGVALADTNYTVQPGDSLSAIAARFGVSVDAIVSANNLPSRSTIYAGQVLRIPSAANPNQAPTSQPAGTPGAAQTYVVQSGDSLSLVAGRFGVTVQALAAANNLSTNAYLYVGQTLRIPAGGVAQPPAPTPTPVPPTDTPKPTNTPAPPTPTSGPGETVRYTVQRGDNLSSIAYKHNTSVQAIMTANNIANPDSLEVGQVLTITKGKPGTPVNEEPAEPETPMGALGPKWIELDLSTQMLVAYEGTTPVFSARMSSGTSRTPTVTGTYRVYLKYRSQRMRGGTRGIDYYDIPNVPHVMYFYSGYAIHGVWWHTNFGSPQSHGCINLTREHARWMWEWAPLGTLVVSHR